MNILKDNTTRQMDSTEKILFHQEWLKKWKANPFDVYPIYFEIAPVGYCNHRCIFCAFDYTGYKKAKLPADILKARVSEMAALGVKAIQYAGEGEPLLHPDFAEIAVHTRNAGIEMAMLTNGVLLTKKFVEKALDAFMWFQVSLDAATPETHAKIHRVPLGHFPRIIKNLAYAAEVKAKRGIACEIGVQMLLLPFNFKEAVPLALKLKEIGVDYLTLKPYSHNPLSVHSEEDVLGDSFNFRDLFCLEEELGSIAGGGFSVDFRKAAMNEIESERDCDRCLAVPNAWGHICGDGDVYACGPYLGDERFLLGNINRQTFQEIWQGDRRKVLFKWMGTYDVKRYCRRVCRMNMTNKTLNGILNGTIPLGVLPERLPSRVNFI